MRISPSFARAIPVLALFALLPSTPAVAGPPAAPGLVGFHVEPLAVLSAEQKAELGVAGDHGVHVAAIVANGPAARAGLETGDRLCRFAEYEVPDLRSDADEARHLWRVAIRMMMGNARAGEPIPVVVERGGAQRTLTLTPVTAAEMHRLQADEVAADLPALAEAGPAAPLAVDFQGLGADALLPPGFCPYEGCWRVVREAEGTDAALRQDRMILPWAVLLVAGRGRCYTDAAASVRFLPVSGVVDASGGIIFRAQDPLNYYLVRPNALEDNFRLYRMKDGVRTQLATVTVTPPEKHTWHVIEVTFRGPSFRATLDGKDLVEARDGTFASGWCGLWTKADSVTLFDDLKVVPEPATR
jgi:hypothetical protein